MKRVFEKIAIACLKSAICNRRTNRIANFDETAPRPIIIGIALTFYCVLSLTRNTLFLQNLFWQSTVLFYTVALFGLRPQTQPIYLFGIGVPKWQLFL